MNCLDTNTVSQKCKHTNKYDNKVGKSNVSNIFAKDTEYVIEIKQSCHIIMISSTLFFSKIPDCTFYIFVKKGLS